MTDRLAGWVTLQAASPAVSAVSPGCTAVLQGRACSLPPPFSLQLLTGENISLSLSCDTCRVCLGRPTPARQDKTEPGVS